MLLAMRCYELCLWFLEHAFKLPRALKRYEDMKKRFSFFSSAKLHINDTSDKTCVFFQVF